MKTFVAALACALSLIGAPAVAQNAAEAATHYAQVNGDRIGYRSIGSGPPLVLATRMRGTLDTWDPLFLDELAKSHRVITFDYPGVGYSSGTLPEDFAVVAEIIHVFTREIGLDRFAMLGWSWGGFATQALMVARPERVTHAILVGTNPPGGGDIPIQEVFLERAIKPVNDLADEEVLFFEPRSAASRRAARESNERIYARPGVVERIPSRQEQFDVYFRAATAFRADTAGRLAKLVTTDTPILVICGDNDTSTAAQNWFPLVGRLPTAQLLVYPSAGHGPQHQLPELSAAYIKSFIAATTR